MPSNQRGLTLTEVTITMVLASIVMFGLIGFYLSSQGTWMDASSKAITQREATTLVETIAERVHAASSAEYFPATHRLELRDLDGNPQYAFWWSDGKIHEGISTSADRGSPITSVCQRFECPTNESMVSLDILLRSAQGDSIAIDTRIALLNRSSSTP